MTTGTTVPASGFAYYISLVKTADVVGELEQMGESMAALLASLDEVKGNYAYAPGKWTIKELIGHLCDSERIFAYRALRFARNDSTVLSPFEQDDYIANADFNSRTLKDLARELYLIRQSNVILFRSFNKEMMQRKGFSGTNELSVHDLICSIAGHEKHHMKVLKEKYLS